MLNSQTLQNLIPLDSLQLVGACKSRDILEMKFPMLFPMTKISKNLITPQESFNSFVFSKSKIILSDVYDLTACTLKSGGGRRIAKIYDKQKIRVVKGLVEQIKTELICSLNLQKSRSILKLDYVIENKTHMYLIYEPAELIDQVLAKEIMSLQFLKKLFFQVTVGISELNSLGVGLLDFGKQNIAVTKEGEYKIFSFHHIFEIDSKISKTSIPLDSENVAPEVKRYGDFTQSSQSWSLGILLLEMIKIFENSSDSLEKGKKKMKREESLREIYNFNMYNKDEKDLLECLLSVSPTVRLQPKQILLHPYLLTFISGSPLILENLPKSYISSIPTFIAYLKKQNSNSEITSKTLIRKNSDISIDSKNSEETVTKREMRKKGRELVVRKLKKRFSKTPEVHFYRNSRGKSMTKIGIKHNPTIRKIMPKEVGQPKKSKNMFEIIFGGIFCCTEREGK